MNNISGLRWSSSAKFPPAPGDTSPDRVVTKAGFPSGLHFTLYSPPLLDPTLLPVLSHHDASPTAAASALCLLKTGPWYWWYLRCSFESGPDKLKIEVWTVPDHYVMKRIGLVCVGAVNVALHSIFPQKCIFPPNFSVFIYFIIIGPAGRFHTRLLPPAACRQHPPPKKDVNERKKQSKRISLEWETSCSSESGLDGDVQTGGVGSAVTRFHPSRGQNLLQTFWSGLQTPTDPSECRKPGKNT